MNIQLQKLNKVLSSFKKGSKEFNNLNYEDNIELHCNSYLLKSFVVLIISNHS